MKTLKSLEESLCACMSLGELELFSVIGHALCGQASRKFKSGHYAKT